MQNLIANLAKDALQNYPALASVQLDDHFAIPLALLPQNSSAAVVAQLTQAATTVSSSVQANGRLTLSPASIDFALNNYAVDWLSWAKLSLFSTFYPQMCRSIQMRACIQYSLTRFRYRYTSKYFSDEMEYTSQQFANASIAPTSNVSWIPGVRGSGQPLTALPELSGMLDTCDELQTGFVLWCVLQLPSRCSQRH